MKSEAKDIAVIIINYNSSDFTLGCVQSVISKTSALLSYQIIVVDNSSKTSEVFKLKELEDNPLVEVVYSEENLGFGGGNMLGVSRAQANHLFFLNNDCVLINDCLNTLLSFCNDHPRVGLCGPQQYSKDQQLINSFNYMPTPALKFLGPDVLRIFNPKKYPKRHKSYELPVQVELVSGAGLFFKTKAFQEIGGFDTNLFFYCEEEDLGLRLAKLGWEIYLIPEAKYIHFGGGSSSENLVMLKEYYISLMYFFRKHYSGAAYFFLKLLYAFKFFRKSLRNKNYKPFINLILRGAPMQESLRYKQ